MSKFNYMQEIEVMLLQEYPDANVENIRQKLSKASADEVERVYDAFSRFGVKAVLESM